MQSPKESTEQCTAACQGKRNLYLWSTAAAHCCQRLSFGQKGTILHVLANIISAALSAGWRVSLPGLCFISSILCAWSPNLLAQPRSANP